MPSVQYGAARAAAALGERDNTLQHLRAALALQPAYAAEAAADASFAALNGDEAFLALLRRSQSGKE